MNFEKTATKVELPISPIEQLFAYISSLPMQPGVTPIQGLVQMRTSDENSIFQDSSIYKPRLVDGQLSFQATAIDGTGRLETFTSIDGSIDTFEGEDNKEYKVAFPNFKLSVDK